MPRRFAPRNDSIFLGGFQHFFDEFLPFRAAADDVHPQPARILRGVLGVAAADPDHRVGIVPPAAADDGPVFLVRHGGDGAGVDDVAVTQALKGADFVAPLRQEALHGLGFKLVGFAAQGIKAKFHCEFHQ